MEFIDFVPPARPREVHWPSLIGTPLQTMTYQIVTTLSGPEAGMASDGTSDGTINGAGRRREARR
jgi:hypothetical protein